MTQDLYQTNKADLKCQTGAHEETKDQIKA